MFKIELTQEKLSKLKEYFKKIPEVTLVVIVGSIAMKGYSYHDIDIVIKVEFKEKKSNVFSKIIIDLAKILEIPLERIDLIDFDYLDLEFKKKLIDIGIIIIDKGVLEEVKREILEKYSEYHEYKELSTREWLRSQDPTRINIDIIKRRLDFIRSEIDFMQQEILNKSVDEVRKSPILKRLLERSFQLIVEAIIDICRHIVSMKGWRIPYHAVSFLEKCYEHGIISQELLNFLIQAVRIRNIIVHRYLEVNYNELYSKAKELIVKVKEFERCIVNFIKQELTQ